MNTLLEKAKQHFKEVVSGEGLRCLEVPEWGEENKPAILYFKPLAALPIKTYSRLITLGSEQTVESFVEMLILRCVDAEGTPLFKSIDKTEMLRCISPVVVCQIITRMSEFDTVPSIEDAKKKLLADPDLLCVYQLAERLHKTISEILMLSVAEFMGWLAYFDIQRDRKK